MRRRITLLVAATSSALVVAFVVPLCALLVTVAEDRASARARDQAQSVAALLGTVEDPAALGRAIETLAVAGPPVVVIASDGRMIGAQGRLAADTSAAVDQARASLTATTVAQDHGIDAIVPVASGDYVDIVVATVAEAEVRSGVLAGWGALISLGVVLVGVAVLMARELGRRVSTPVTDLGEVAHRLSAGDLSARATPSGPEETVEVAKTLNRLADRIDSLLVAERERVADLGHRLRTPVTALRLATDQLTDREAADRIDRLVDELHHSVDEVVREARRPLRDALPTPGDLGAIVSERARFWGALAEDQGRALSLVLPAAQGAPILVTLSAKDVQECVDTLMDNYFSHTPDGAPAVLTVGSDAARGWFDVSDGGPGMTAYGGRGESGGGSTGLGLDIVRRLAASAGGEVRIGPAELGGLSVTVSIPRAV